MTKIIIPIVIFVAFVCATFVATDRIKSTTNAIQTNQFSKLTFEIDTPKKKYVQLEPIPITLKLENKTSSSINYQAFLGFGSNLRLTIRNESNEELQLSGNKLLSSPKSIVVKSVNISPGEIHQNQQLLNNSLETIFSRPGSYNIQASLSNGTTQRILSNYIDIEIVEPHGINRQAYNFIKERLEPAKEEADPRALARLQEQLVNDFGNSVYGKYEAVELASTYQALGEDSKAEKELCKIRNEDFYHSKHVKKKLQEIAAKLRPMPLIPNLPEDAPLPPMPQLCVGLP